MLIVTLNLWPQTHCDGGGDVVQPDPFRGIGVRRNSAETQQSGHAPRSGPEVKNGRSSAKDGALERHMRDNPEGGELDLADDVRMHCKKNSPSVLSSIRGQEKTVTVAAKPRHGI